MSPRLQTINLTIEHVGNAGKRMPVCRMHMSESPLNPLDSETVGDPWIFANVLIVIIINELMSERLTENGVDNYGKRNTDDAADDAADDAVIGPRVGALYCRVSARAFWLAFDR